MPRDREEDRIAYHNEMNPDMRSFGPNGTSSIDPKDEADKEEAEEKTEARENADEDENELELEEEEEEEKEEEEGYTQEDMRDAMWKEGE